MKNAMFLFAPFDLLSGGCATMFTADAQHANIVQEKSDFERSLSYWPGEYENRVQVAQQIATDHPEKDRNNPLRVFISKVDLPAFGEHVYYVEW